MEFVKTIADKPATPGLGTSAILAMGATRSEELANEIIDSYLKDVRDQDVPYVFFGFAANYKFRNWAIKKFQEKYDYVRLLTSSSMKFLTQCSWRNVFKAIGHCKLLSG